LSSDAWCPGLRGDHGGVGGGVVPVAYCPLDWRSPSVVCCEITCHRGRDGAYRAEEASKAVRLAGHRPKKHLLDCDEALRRRVITDLP